MMPENGILNHKIQCRAIVSFIAGVRFESADKWSFLGETRFRITDLQGLDCWKKCLNMRL